MRFMVMITTSFEQYQLLQNSYHHDQRLIGSGCLHKPDRGLGFCLDQLQLISHNAAFITAVITVITAINVIITIIIVLLVYLRSTELVWKEEELCVSEKEKVISEHSYCQFSNML